MKLSVAREALLDRLQTLVRVASTHSAVQALSGVQLDAADTAIELRATDLEVGLRMPLEGSVARPGAVVLPARLLLDVVRALPAGDVELELRAAEQDVELRCGAATFDIRTLRSEDFPALPTAQPESAVTVPGEAFVETITTVARSASRDETRPVLTGILVSASGKELRMVATDSYRLSVKETPLEAELEGSFEANVPARALQELARIAQHAGADDLRVGMGENQVVFEVGGATLSSRLIDADAGRRRGTRGDPDSLLGRGAGDRLQPGLPARRVGERELGRRRDQAHQLPAPGPHRGRGRKRLPVSDHADPAERVAP